MKFLEILEKAWIAAAVLAIGMAIFNLVTKQKFDHFVYFPLLCGGFCILLYMNIRGQRRFAEAMKKGHQKKTQGPSAE